MLFADEADVKLPPFWFSPAAPRVVDVLFSLEVLGEVTGSVLFVTTRK